MVNANTLILEKDFQATVRQYAKSHGWKVFCTYDSRRSPEGEPDLRMVRPPRVIFAELKTETGKLTKKQTETFHLLRQCPGVETYLWRPSDWDSIERMLK